MTITWRYSVHPWAAMVGTTSHSNTVMYQVVFIIALCGRNTRLPLPCPEKHPHTVTPCSCLLRRNVKRGLKRSEARGRLTQYDPSFTLTRNVLSSEKRIRSQSCSVQCWYMLQKRILSSIVLGVRRGFLAFLRTLKPSFFWRISCILLTLRCCRDRLLVFISVTFMPGLAVTDLLMVSRCLSVHLSLLLLPLNFNNGSKTLLFGSSHFCLIHLLTFEKCALTSSTISITVNPLWDRAMATFLSERAFTKMDTKVLHFP